MKLNKIIAIADKVYPDGLIQQAFNLQSDPINWDHSQGRSVGDGLAEFIARELAETYDSKASSLDQLHEAARCIELAKREVTSVADILTRELSNMAVSLAKRRKK